MGIVKTYRKSSREIKKQFLIVHYPLYYKIIMMILTKRVNSTFKGSFHLNVGVINCAKNVRKIGQFRKHFNAGYSLYLSYSYASITILFPIPNLAPNVDYEFPCARL